MAPMEASISSSDRCLHCGVEDILDRNGLCALCAAALTSTCEVCGNPIGQCICKLDEPGGD